MKLSINERVAKTIALHLPRKHNQKTHGRGGMGGPSPTPGLRKTSERAFNGQPKPLKNKPAKNVTGTVIGERVALSYLREHRGMKDARPANDEQANYAVDVVGDHAAFEIKAGLVSNGKSAQHWRATIGEPGVKEKAQLAAMTPEQKRAHNDRKEQLIIQRKQAALEKYAAETGVPVKAKTLTMVLDTDKKVADVFEFDGFHIRIPWNSDKAKSAYVGSYSYGDLGLTDIPWDVINA